MQAIGAIALAGTELCVSVGVLEGAFELAQEALALVMLGGRHAQHAPPGMLGAQHPFPALGHVSDLAAVGQLQAGEHAAQRNVQECPLARLHRQLGLAHEREIGLAHLDRIHAGKQVDELEPAPIVALDGLHDTAIGREQADRSAHLGGAALVADQPGDAAAHLRRSGRAQQPDRQEPGSGEAR